MQLEEFLEGSARTFPHKTALVCGERRFQYREIDQQCNRLAVAMASCGIERWDRVVICLENSVEAVVAIFATLKAGATFVMVNPGTKSEKLRYIIDDCGARAVISDWSRIGGVLDFLEASGVRAIFLAASIRHQTPECELPNIAIIPLPDVLDADQDYRVPQKRCIDMDLAALIYTSGSTGRPKGVMVSHLNMISAANSIISYLDNTSEDVILNVLPLSFGYGLYQALTAFRVGATLVLEKTFAYPAAVLQRMASERATGMPVVPTIAAMLLQMDLTPWDLSSLRYVTNAGAALPLQHLARLRSCLPQAKIYCMYGLTECQRVSYLPPDQIDWKAGSVGRGMPNEEICIVDENNKRARPGEVGELVVRGSHVMQGYWRLPEETAVVLRPGRFPWERVLYTGDLFRADEDGYLYFVARKDDMIKTRGEKVSPKEVEDVLHKLAGVAEAAVVGVDDGLLGQAVKAVIVKAEGSSMAKTDVLRHCAEYLEDFMVPRIVEFRSSLPKTPNGKVARRELVDPEKERPASTEPIVPEGVAP